MIASPRVTSPQAFPPGSGTLPETLTVLNGVRNRLQHQFNDGDALRGYVYRLAMAQHELDGRDAIEKTETIDADVYYFDHGPFRKLLTENGSELSEDEASQQDEQFDIHVRGAITQDPVRRPWLGAPGDSEADRAGAIADVFNGFNFAVVGRDFVDDRPAIVVEFSPSQDAEYQSGVGRMILAKVAGRAWVDEEDSSLVRIDARIVQDITVGPFGSFARISEGAEYMREWRKVNNEVWLPSSFSMTIEARAFLLKKTHRQIVEQYSNYRKFYVDPEFEIRVEE